MEEKKMKEAKLLVDKLQVIADEMEIPVEELVSKCCEGEGEDEGEMESESEDMGEMESKGPDKTKVAFMLAKMKPKAMME